VTAILQKLARRTSKGQGWHLAKPRDGGSKVNETTTKGDGHDTLTKQLESLTPANNVEVIEAKKAESAVLAKYEHERQRLEDEINPALQEAKSLLRNSRVALAEGIGDASAVEKARKVFDAAEDRATGQEDLVRALGAKCADSRDAVRSIESKAAQQARGDILKLAAANIVARNILFSQLEELTNEANSILSALEVACPTTLSMDLTGRIIGSLRPGWQDSWETILSTRSRMQLDFFHDETAPHGGVLGVWRSLAEQTGLLEMSPTTRVRVERRKREQDSHEAYMRRVEAINNLRRNESWRKPDDFGIKYEDALPLPVNK